MGPPVASSRWADSDDMRNSTRKYVAECIGTFVLVLGGVGTAVLAGDRVGFLGVSLAFGLSLLAMAYTVGPVSGCHVNPAVTVSMLLARKIGAKDSAGYIVFQCIGAVLATVIIVAIANGAPGGYDIDAKGLGANGYGDHSPGGFNLTAAFLAEAILTAVLCITVLGSTSIKAPVGFAGIPIGLVLAVIHLVSIPITNTSVNPARSLGPALFVGDWALTQLWVFVAAPLVGGILAAGLYAMVGSTSKEGEPVIDVGKAESALKSEQRERKL